MLFRNERAKWQCISVSTAMTMLNVVNPTSNRRTSERRVELAPAIPSEEEEGEAREEERALR